MSQWYVIQTKPLREGDVCVQLQRANFEVYFPKIQKFVASKFGQQKRAQPLFPSYVFAKANLLDGNVYKMIKYTRGVNKILGCDSIPVALPAGIVETIRSRVFDGSLTRTTDVLKPGDPVRMRRGVLKDLIGILDRPVSALGRVRVLLHIMQRQMVAEVNYSSVERLS